MKMTNWQLHIINHFFRPIDNKETTHILFKILSLSFFLSFSLSLSLSLSLFLSLSPSLSPSISLSLTLSCTQTNIHRQKLIDNRASVTSLQTLMSVGWFFGWLVGRRAGWSVCHNSKKAGKLLLHRCYRSS